MANRTSFSPPLQKTILTWTGGSQKIPSPGIHLLSLRTFFFSFNNEYAPLVAYNISITINVGLFLMDLNVGPDVACSVLLQCVNICCWSSPRYDSTTREIMKCKCSLGHMQGKESTCSPSHGQGKPCQSHLFNLWKEIEFCPQCYTNEISKTCLQSQSWRNYSFIYGFISLPK